MNNILRYSQLAKALGVSNASISMAIKNGKLTPNERDKTIDITDPLNKLWLDGQIRKGKTFDINRIYDKITKVEKEKPKTEPKETSDTEEEQTTGKTEKLYADLKKIEYEQKRATLKKTKYEAKKLELQTKKIEGELIPYDEAEFLLNYIIEKIRGIQIQEVDGMASIYKARFKISHSEYIEVKKDILEIINNSYKDGVEDLKSGIDGIKEQYSEVRGRGERK